MYAHLLQKFKGFVPGWKASQLKNTLLMVALLLEEKTVNLWSLKGGVGKLLGNTATDSRSHYQRLKRWLWSGKEDKSLWVGMLQAAVSLLEKKSQLLILDGSSWKWGGSKYHFLTLSVLYQGVSIPVWWQDLKKLGISSQWQREVMLRVVLKVVRLKGKVLLADREYIGTRWFCALQRAGIGFAIRLRKGNYQQQIERKGKTVSKLEQKAKAQVGRPLWKKFTLKGHSYYYVLKAYRTRSGKLAFLRLITTLTPARAMESYGYRYRIESMFKHLKSNGFSLESLHVKKEYKVNMMMAALVLAYTLSVVYGLKKYKRCIAVKGHGSREMSVFRYGLDLWQNHLQSFALFLKHLCNYCKVGVKEKSLVLNLNVP